MQRDGEDGRAASSAQAVEPPNERGAAGARGHRGGEGDVRYGRRKRFIGGRPCRLLNVDATFNGRRGGVVVCRGCELIGSTTSLSSRADSSCCKASTTLRDIRTHLRVSQIYIQYIFDIYKKWRAKITSQLLLQFDFFFLFMFPSFPPLPFPPSSILLAFFLFLFNILFLTTPTPPQDILLLSRGECSAPGPSPRPPAPNDARERPPSSAPCRPPSRARRADGGPSKPRRRRSRRIKPWPRSSTATTGVSAAI